MTQPWTMDEIQTLLDADAAGDVQLSMDQLRTLRDIAVEMEAASMVPDLGVEMPTTPEQLSGPALAGQWLAGTVTGAPKKKMAEERGIGYDEPVDFRTQAMASLPPDSLDQLATLKRELDQKFGQDTQLFFDQDLDSLVYQHPDKGWQFVNRPGLDFGDVASIVGELPTAAGEVAAGLTEFLFKRPQIGGFFRTLGRGARVTAGQGAGAYVGERVRLEEAERRGLFEHRTPEELEDLKLMAPAKAAAVAAGGTAVIGGALTGGKTAIDYYAGRRLPFGYAERGINLPDIPEAITTFNTRMESLGRPERLNPTTGELLNDPSVIQFERGIGTQHYMERKIQQQEAAKAMAEEAGGLFRTQRSPLDVGRDVRATVEDKYGAAERAMADRVSTAETQLRDTSEQIGSIFGRARPQDIAPQIRGVAEAEQTKFREWANKAYSDILGNVEQKSFIPFELRGAAKGQLDHLQKDIAPTLTAENRRVVEGLVESLSEASATGNVPASIRLHYLNRFITQIKSAERRANDGLLGDVDARQLAELRRAAITDRQKFLDSIDPDMARELQELDVLYRERKTLLNNTVIGDIMKQKGGVHRVKDEAAFRKVFGPDRSTLTNARQFNQILSQPEHVAVRDDFKAAIAEDYLSKVVKDGNPNRNAHIKWMRDHDAMLREYLPAEDRELFAQVGGAADYLMLLKGRQKSFEQAMNNAVGAPLRGRDPSDIVDYIWSKPERIEAAMRVLRQHPDTSDAVRGAALKKLETNFKRFDKNMHGDIIHLDALSGTLRKNEDQIRFMFGDQYLSDLTTLRDGLAVVSREAGAAGIEEGGRGAVADLLFSWWVGPLSHTGYAVRKALGTLNRAEAENLSRVVLDPDALREIADKVVSKPGSRAARATLGAMGFQAMGMDSPDEALAPDAIQRIVPGLTPEARQRILEAVGQ